MRLYAILSFLLSVPLLAAPQITSIAPQQGFTYQPTTVTITGTEFGPDAEVLFDTTAGTIREVLPHRIVVLAPPMPAGRSVDVTVRTGGQQLVLRDAFTYLVHATGAPADYTRYLIPVIGQHTPGQHGSVWTTEWAFFNPTEWDAWMVWAQCPPLASPCPNPVVAARRTARLAAHPLGRAEGADGAFIYIPKRIASGAAMTLRVRDVRQSANFGTEVRIVHENEYTNQQRQGIALIDIPTDPKFRATLRIYSNHQAPHPVHMRISNERNETIVEQDVELYGGTTTMIEPFVMAPAYAQLDPLTPAVRASGERVRVELAAYSPLLISPPLVLPIWAFVTLTNNETQQVTTITPHQ